MLQTDPFADLESLLRQCRNGDSRAWSAMVDRFQSHVYSIARRVGLPEEDASDVFQRTFIAFYRTLDRIEAGKAIPKWLATTAVRESLRVKRSKRGSPAELDAQPEGLSNLLAREETDVHLLAETALDAFHIRSALRKLGANCRDLLEALYGAGQCSYQEAAQKFGIAMGSVGPRRARCINRLRKILEESGFFHTK